MYRLAALAHLGGVCFWGDWDQGCMLGRDGWLGKDAMEMAGWGIGYELMKRDGFLFEL